MKRRHRPARAIAAFLSYGRRLDSRIAVALKHGLQTFAKPWFRGPVASVFLDDTNLTANPDLWSALRDKIQSSSFCILLASPQAASSKWVSKELASWLSGGACDDANAFAPKIANAERAARTMVVLTEGDIVWSKETNDFDWTRTTSLPRLMAGVFAAEPTWVDLRWTRDATDPELSRRDERFRKATAKLAAPMRGIDVIPLIDKDYIEHQRTIRHAS